MKYHAGDKGAHYLLRDTGDRCIEVSLTRNELLSMLIIRQDLLAQK
jgi:hypothetical protein